MKVFISHSFDDKGGKHYKDLRRALRKEGHELFDTENLLAGLSLADQLRRTIESIHVCVFLATTISLESKWCFAELGAFWGVGKKIVVFAPNVVDESSLLPQLKGALRADTIKRVIEGIEASDGFHSDLLGVWDCKWTRDSSFARKSIPADTVRIEAVSEHRIAAEGGLEGDAEKYFLSGYVLKGGLVTLTYEGEGTHKHLGWCHHP